MFGGTDVLADSKMSLLETAARHVDGVRAPRWLRPPARNSQHGSNSGAGVRRSCCAGSSTYLDQYMGSLVLPSGPDVPVELSSPKHRTVHSIYFFT